MLITQAADGNYQAISSSVTAGTITVNQGTPTITPYTQTITYGQTSTVTIPSTVSNSSGTLTFSLQSPYPSGTTINSSTGVVTIGGIGTITVLITQAAYGNYQAISSSVTAGTIIVSAATSVITPAATQTITYGQTSTVTVTPTSTNATGAFTFSLQSGFPTGTTINSSTGVVTIGGAGTINVLVTQAASGNYTAITTPVAAGTIIVSAATPVITPAATQTITYGQTTTVTVTPTSTNSTGAFTFSLQSGFPTGTTINTSTGVVTIGGAGTINVLVTQASSGNYSAITTPVAAGTINVSIATTVITSAATQTVTYGETATVTLTPTSTNTTGAFTFSLQSGFPTGTTINTSTGLVTIGNIGTINVLVTQAATTNYSAVTTPVAAGTIIVSAPITIITPAVTQTITYGETSTVTVTPTSTNTTGTFTFSLQSGFPTGTTINTSTGVVTIGGAGTINVLVTQAASGNYAAITTPVAGGTIIVSKIVPIITPAVTQTITYGQKTTLTVTPTSTNTTGVFTFSLQSGFPTGTTINSSTGVVTIGSAGTIYVLVTQAESGNYSAITTPAAAGTINISGATPIITPAATQTITYGQTATVTVTPTSTNTTGAFTFSLQSPYPTGTTINASTGVVTIGSAGIINVLITQAALGNYVAITNPVAAGTIIVSGPPTIIPAVAQTIIYGETSKVTVTPTSSSPGAFTFSLQPGYNGSSAVNTVTGEVTLGGRGTVNVLVTQAASGIFTAVTEPVLAGTITVVYVSTIPCFKKNTKILTKNGYIPIENLKKGDLIKTLKNEYLPINKIGYKYINYEKEILMYDKLFKCSNDKYPEILEDLYITGLHSILVDNLTEEQESNIKEIYNDIFVTDDKYRLPVCFDERATLYENESRENIIVYHMALDNENENMNYGIYANGLLVETTSINIMSESYWILI